jgi:hypothetical protein
MENKIKITKENLVFIGAKLDFTHNHESVEIGSIMFDRDGNANEVTKIDKDECGRRRFWSGANCLTVQYSSPHNMLTKSPYYAHNFSTFN